MGGADMQVEERERMLPALPAPLQVAFAAHMGARALADVRRIRPEVDQAYPALQQGVDFLRDHPERSPSRSMFDAFTEYERPPVSEEYLEGYEQRSSLRVDSYCGRKRVWLSPPRSFP